MSTHIRRGFAQTIGNTPLIRLNKLSDETGCEILGKAEFMNPGGSVKDRAARGIIEEAERSGRLKPGGTLVEGTAGNTGIGFAHVCNERGYRCVIVMPDNQSNEKYQMIEALGNEFLCLGRVRQGYLCIEVIQLDRQDSVQICIPAQTGCIHFFLELFEYGPPDLGGNLLRCVTHDMSS